MSILVALPLLLFSSRIQDLFVHSKKLLIGFAIAVFAGIVAILISASIFGGSIAEIWQPAGMMAGIHTGGTPNLFSVGVALEAKDEVMILTNTSQMFWGGIFLIFILSYAKSFYGRFLALSDVPVKNDVGTIRSYIDYQNFSIRDSLYGIVMVALIILVSLLISHLTFGNLHPTLIIILVTTGGIFASFYQPLQKLKGPFEVGDYFLLMFGVAVGLLSDYEQLLKDGGSYIAFIGVIFLLTVFFQLTMAYLFKIDVDTIIVASTAAIFGPVFIPQVTRAIENKSILIGGITISLLGLAIGNYIGIGLGELLRLLL